MLGRKPWTVPWERARKVHIELWGQRLTIDTRDWRGKSARLDDESNSFLVRPVIEHAARRPGVVVSAH